MATAFVEAKRLPETLNVDQLNQLLSFAADEPLAKRDLAIMELLYGCGLRLAELVNLNLDAIDWQQQVISVVGKGRKHRRIPFGDKAAKAVKNWLAERNELNKKKNEPAVFA